MQMIAIILAWDDWEYMGMEMHTSQLLGPFRFMIKMTFISHVSESQSALLKVYFQNTF